MRNRFRKAADKPLTRLLGAGACALAATATGIAFAAPAPAGGHAMLEEVQVTARKITENLQVTPIAVTAISDELLESAALADVTAISAVTPSLNFSLGQSGGSSALQAFIRGVGEVDYMLTTDPAVGFYMDGVYVARTAAANLDLLGVDHIEVLRGPQGTLFGKNSIGGAISITTRKPSGDTLYQWELSTGSHSAVGVRAYGEMALVPDVLAGSLSFLYKDSDGWQKRPGNDGGEEHRYAARGILRWTPSDNFESVLSFDNVEQNQASYANVLLEVNPNSIAVSAYNNWGLGPDCCTPNSRTRSGATDPRARDDVSANNANWTNTWTLNDSFTIKSITGYREFEADFGQDYDHSDALFYAFGDETTQEQFSQEFQFLGKALDGRLDWVVGLYYFTEDGTDTSDLLLVPQVVAAGMFPLDFNLRSNNEQTSDSEGVFGHLNFAMTEKLSLSAGLRYTREEKEYNKDSMRVVTNVPQFPAGASTPSSDCSDIGPAASAGAFECEADWESLAPKVGLSYQVDDDMMAYLNVSRGFRSGGFNGRPTALSLITSYDPEYLTSYEVGFKSELLDRRLRFNTALYYNDYTDKQQTVNVADPGESTTSLLVNNAGEANIKGFEMELTALLTDAWTVNATLGYTDAEFTKWDDALEGDLSYREFPHAPKWTAGLNSQYVFGLGDGGEVILWAGANYKDSVYLDAENTEALHVDGYTLVNANVRYRSPDQRWEVTLGGKNLTDEDELVSGFENLGFFGILHGNPLQPRRWELSVKYANF